ncbi:hypothetical protein ACR9GP_25585 [Enterobacter ludwigii]
MKKQMLKGVTVQLDAETTLALNRVREQIRVGLDEAGFNGLAMMPSLGAIARETLRRGLGLPPTKSNAELFKK